MSNLYKKLLPIAKEQVLILKRQERYRNAGSLDECVVMHLSTTLITKISELHQIVRDNKLLYLACALSSHDCATLLSFIPAYSLFSKANQNLCISDQELWLECTIYNQWGNESFVTNRINLKELIPLDLLPIKFKEIKTEQAQLKARSYQSRIEALRDAEKACESISVSVAQLDTSVPDEHLVLLESLTTKGADRPFRAARRALDEFESNLEIWENNLELERTEICCQALGVEIGDDLLYEENGRSVRIRLQNASLHFDEEGINFHLWGKRFRKDGVLGKRDEYLFLQVSKD